MYQRYMASLHDGETAIPPPTMPTEFPCECSIYFENPDGSRTKCRSWHISSRKWEQHVRTVHLKAYPCNEADCVIKMRRFGNSNDLKRHQNTSQHHHIGHNPAPKFKCCKPMCQRSKTFMRKDKFDAHNQKWHGDYFCDVEHCVRGEGYGLGSEQLLEAHVRKAHPPCPDIHKTKFSPAVS